MKNPCIGLPFHGKDANELLEAVEKANKRQGNPASQRKMKAFLRKNPGCDEFYEFIEVVEGKPKHSYFTSREEAVGEARFLSKREWLPVDPEDIHITRYSSTAGGGKMQSPIWDDREIAWEAEPNPRKKKASKRKATKKKATKKKAPRKAKTLKGRAKRAEKKIDAAAKRAGKRIKKDTEAAGKDVKKFAKTKTGYGALGAGAGALLLGPIGAIAGAIGASKLHDNPLVLNDWLRDRLPTMSDSEVLRYHEQYSTMLDKSSDPRHDFGTKGVRMVRSVIKDTEAELKSRDLELNPSKKKSLKKKAKKAGRKAKKFAKTKTGYGALGAGAGALLLGPIGAVAGALGGSALHDNPRRMNPSKAQHHARGDRKWNMFEEAWGSYTISNSPEDLLAAYTAAVEAELHYAHAGVENEDGMGYGPAGAEAAGIRSTIFERLEG